MRPEAQTHVTKQFAPVVAAPHRVDFAKSTWSRDRSDRFRVSTVWLAQSARVRPAEEADDS